MTLSKYYQKKLKYKYKLYERRYETISSRLKSTGQSHLIPAKIDYEVLKQNATKENIKQIIKELDSYRIASIVTKNRKTGKYGVDDEIIEGKYGAKISKKEYEDLKRIQEHINRQKEIARKELEKRGYIDESLDYVPLSFNLDVSQEWLNEVKAKLRSRQFIGDYFQHTMQIKRQNLYKGIEDTLGEHAEMLKKLLDSLDNYELDDLLRSKDGYINFEYMYDKESKEELANRISKILYHFREYMGEERYNEFMLNNGYEEYINVEIIGTPNDIKFAKTKIKRSLDNIAKTRIND